MMDMFDHLQYIIEKSKLERLKSFRGVYDVKDAHGNRLGYVKQERLKGNFWFERTNGERMGEVKLEGNEYRVYDAEKQLRGIIERVKPRGWKETLFGKPKWRIEDSGGQQIAEVKETGKFLRTRARYQILAPDGGLVGEISLKLSFAPGFRGYRINISRQDLDTILTISYTIILAQFIERIA